MEWIKVQDRYPEDGEEICAVWDGNEITVNHLWYDLDYLEFQYENILGLFHIPNVTHWMGPIKPPKE